MNSTGYHDSLNDHGERLQGIGDIILNLDYWDCECENNFIHPISQQRCDSCGSVQEECPSSRENEVWTSSSSLKK
ncbi:MAG: hypothetical protein M0Z70_06425 [Nitrospiraceae bacterium]|jgi:hypothetical protein|nr:hypothetical protein [Nitrospiraceae bacterium]